MTINKQSIIYNLRENKPNLSQHGVSKIGLFGSYVRQEENADSDIDILVDFKEGEDKYDNLIYVYDLLESIFVDTKIEVVTVNGLSPYIGPHVLKEVEYA